MFSWKKKNILTEFKIGLRIVTSNLNPMPLVDKYQGFDSLVKIKVLQQMWVSYCFPPARCLPLIIFPPHIVKKCLIKGACSAHPSSVSSEEFWTSSSDFGNHCVWRFIAENYIRNILDECQPSDFVNHWETLSESSDFGNHWKIPFSPSAAAMNSETGKHWREFQIQTYSAADTNHNWGFKLWIFYLNSI